MTAVRLRPQGLDIPERMQEELQACVAQLEAEFELANSAEE
jgi:hypothetical protein